MPKDQHGNDVSVGAHIRILRFDERGLHGLLEDECARALSMVGEIFEVEEIEDYGRPCVTKKFPGDASGRFSAHGVALDPDEFEVVTVEHKQHAR